jgi:hypothetical protein
MYHVWERSKVLSGFWFDNLNLRDQFKDLGVDGWILLKWSLKKYDVRPWAGRIWLRIGSSGRLL